MNFQPFSRLPVGAICQDLDHAELLLMKTNQGSRALVLRSVWIDDKLYPRGTLVEMGKNECVNALEEGEDLPLPLKRQDPVDPRRQFWKDGDKRQVGRDLPTHVNVFAGLFVYSGFGMGTYYASTDHEAIWCNAEQAEKRALIEGVPCVRFDSKDWTNDPNLTREREEARVRHEARKARLAQQTAAGLP